MNFALTFGDEIQAASLFYVRNAMKCYGCSGEIARTVTLRLLEHVMSFEFALSEGENICCCELRHDSVHYSLYSDYVRWAGLGCIRHFKDGRYQNATCSR